MSNIDKLEGKGEHDRIDAIAIDCRVDDMRDMKETEVMALGLVIFGQLGSVGIVAAQEVDPNTGEADLTQSTRVLVIFDDGGFNLSPLAARQLAGTLDDVKSEPIRKVRQSLLTCAEYV